MRRLLEKGAILSLSLLLTSTYSVSTVIPSMVEMEKWNFASCKPL